jgi:6-phosphogluconolactonase (cycloisomerase 2 family)
MKIEARVLLSALALLAMMFLAACGGGYNCQVTFGSSTCTPSGGGVTLGGGGGGGGGGGNGIAAFVFAVDTTNAAIDGYTLNTTAGTLALTNGYLAPTIPTNSGGVGMVVAQEQFLYVGFGITDQIYGWTISSTGTLTAISGSPFSAPYLSNYVGTVGQAEMITNPLGTMLFVSDTSQGEIYAYTIGSGGVLAAATGSPFSLPSGFLPMNLTTDGLGNYLYAINGNSTTHTGSEIAAFAISGGVLTPVVGSPFAFPMWQVEGDPTGQFLIGTSGKTVFYDGTDDDNLYVFNITPSGASAGALTQIAVVPTVYSPFSIATQSNSGGNLVYSFGFNDTDTGFNPIEGYSINSTTGALQVLSGSPFSEVGDGSWGQFDQSGDFLMVYSSYLNPSTDTVATQLAPLDLSSAGALTQPVATLTLVTPGFWVVTDPN